MFTTPFGSYVCDHDAIACEVGPLTVRAWTERDDCADRPDERSEGYWPSLDPESAGYIGPKSRRTLARHMTRAKTVMNAWINDDWDYCGVCVRVYLGDVPLTDKYAHTVWGIERNYPTFNKRDAASPNAYLMTVANELLSDALAEARENAAKLSADCALVLA